MKNERELVIKEAWGELDSMQKISEVLKEPHIPTYIELLKCQEEPLQHGTHKKMVDMTLQASSEKVTKLVFAFYEVCGAKAQWISFANTMNIPKPASYDDELHNFNAVLSSVFQAVQEIGEVPVRQFVEMHREAIKILHDEEQLAANAENWERALNVEHALEELRLNMPVSVLQRTQPEEIHKVFQRALQVVSGVFDAYVKK